MHKSKTFTNFAEQNKNNTITTSKKNTDMKLNEFINMCVMAQIGAISHAMSGYKTFDEIYDNIHIRVPLIHCNDGFTISIQVGNSNYASSENGYRTFGYEWGKAEWGFPSNQIDPILYNAEGGYYDENGKFVQEGIDTTRSVGSCKVSLLDELLNEHGGMDVNKSVQGLYKEIKSSVSAIRIAFASTY